MQITFLFKLVKTQLLRHLFDRMNRMDRITHRRILSIGLYSVSCEVFLRKFPLMPPQKCVPDTSSRFQVNGMNTDKQDNDFPDILFILFILSKNNPP
jgi:hypothetical protein